jgi:hypothetical protein
MPRKTTSLEAVATIGIDIGKNTFHLIGLDKMGAIVLRQKLSRSQIDARLANMPPCLIGMEACVGAHHLSRQLKAFGHDARLMPPPLCPAVFEGTEERLPRRGSDCRGGAASHHEVCRDQDGRTT